MPAFNELLLEDQARLEAAAGWWRSLERDPAVELSYDFLEWLAEPRNCEAFEAVKTSMTVLNQFGATERILGMRQVAIGNLRRSRLRGPFWLRPTGAVAAAVLTATVTAGSIATYLILQRSTTYRTDVGERRVVALTDGSRISIDSDTVLVVSYSAASRKITLKRGRARFDVAHDTTRPFAVTVGSHAVVAVGTSFDVENFDSDVLVTMLQGRVLVEGVSNAPLLAQEKQHLVSLTAGQQLIVAANEERVVTSGDLEAATAWETGHIVFRNELLGHAVEQVNRYTAHPISVEPSAASIRISGMFNTGDIGSFVSAVTEYFPVEAMTTKDEIRLQKRS